MPSDLKSCKSEVKRDLIWTREPQDCKLTSLDGVSFETSDSDINVTSLGLLYGKYEGSDLPDKFNCEVEDNRRLICDWEKNDSD